ncbi:hypothetical protein U6G28_04525 [Actinomycetaceae bacterium MB13-C1-2]|nr:hypothetical protein U6G28_04525 [Actinomycetaceae bacterium MB13-C1-2]
MFRRSSLYRGFTAIGLFVLCIGIVAGQLLESYRTAVDQAVGTESQKIVTEQSADGEDIWTYQASLTTAEETFEALKDLSQRESEESFVLLKNEAEALPIAPEAKVTMFGVRSYAPVYSSSMGSQGDVTSIVEIADAFSEKGLRVNPSMQEAYENFFADKEWGGTGTTKSSPS